MSIRTRGPRLAACWAALLALPAAAAAQALPRETLTGLKKATVFVKVDGARIAATDQSRDLAILKVEGVKDLPKPIDPAAKADLVETTPVFVFGFPLGEMLATFTAPAEGPTRGQFVIQPS